MRTFPGPSHRGISVLVKILQRTWKAKKATASEGMAYFNVETETREATCLPSETNGLRDCRCRNRVRPAKRRASQGPEYKDEKPAVTRTEATVGIKSPVIVFHAEAE